MTTRRTGLRIAVVGAGPAGLYTADQLTFGDENDTTVALFERLPVPFGLLRYGVAPDHPTIKSSAATFQEILDRPSVQLYCNVEIGRDLTVGELRESYDAVVYATGADADRRLGISGEDLPGSISATEFVKWYNGHPEAKSCDLSDVRTAVVVGAGNVALDVARILLTSPERLRGTDIPADVMDALEASGVTDVHLVARRGPEHAKFTTKELREFDELPGVDVLVDASQVPTTDPAGISAVTRRNLGVLRSWAELGPTGVSRRLHLHFATRPERIVGDVAVDAVELNSATTSGQLAADLVVRAIGYRSRPLPGVPYDESTGTIPHREHRVQRNGSDSPGEYAVGWAKRGPSGILGTNRGDATDTVEAILADELPSRSEGSRTIVEDVLTQRGIHVLDKNAWARIRDAEKELGVACGRERVKIARWDQLVRAGRGPAVSESPDLSKVSIST